MTSYIGAPENRAVRDNRRKLRRLYDPERKRYLHMNGHMVTANTDYAWRGTWEQAGTLYERSVTRGEAWPYILVKLEERK